MSSFQHLRGVFAAAATPTREDFSCAPEALPALLGFLAQRGCHGALLLGTTGEGPSFAPDERLELMRAATSARNQYPGLSLLVGTGTPSLEETISLNTKAFDLGFDGVVVLPPYFFRNATENGLFEWFKQVITHSIPSDGALLAYHIPPVSGVPISIELLHRLREAFPRQFAGLKDSSGDINHAKKLGEVFGDELIVLNGTDRHLSEALQAHASGCITALANLTSPLARQIWDAHLQDQKLVELQRCLSQARDIMERYLPAPAFIKCLLTRRYNLPAWTVRPPLMPLTPDQVEQALAAWVDIFNE